MLYWFWVLEVKLAKHLYPVMNFLPMSVPLFANLSTYTPSWIFTNVCSPVWVCLVQGCGYSSHYNSCSSSYQVCVEPLSGDHGVTLPQNIEELVHCPTAHCCQCNEVLFVSAFPFICQDNFSPQKPDAVFHFLGLCCTEQCKKRGYDVPMHQIKY